MLFMTNRSENSEYSTLDACKAVFTWATQLGGLKHSPPLHATHLSKIVGRAATKHNKQDGKQKKRFGSKFNFFITCSANSHFSVSWAIALEYINAVLSPRLAGMNRIHGKKISHLEGCPGKLINPGYPVQHVKECIF